MHSRREPPARSATRGPSALTRPVLPMTAFVAGVLLLAAVLTGCATGRTVPADPAGITGSITSMVAGDERPASFLVEGASPQPAGAVSDKASVDIPPSTQFFDAKGEPATLDAIGGIAKGTRVKVWFQGAVAESYPVQGSAKAVQILGATR